MPKFSKVLVCVFASLALAASAQAGALSLKFNIGGTYLMGGDYNKVMDGWRDYELTVVGPSETFTDNLKKLGLGFQASAEVLYELSPSLAAGLEIGYLSASVESWFSRTWHNYKLTLNPTFSAIPVLLNIHYFLPLGGSLKLHGTAGAGIMLAHLNMKYAIEDVYTPYSGTWIPKDKVVFTAKAGVGVEYALTETIALTFDILGRLGQMTNLTGEYSGMWDGAPYSGTATGYVYDVLSLYPIFVMLENLPSYPNAREATFGLGGLSALFGVRVTI